MRRLSRAYAHSGSFHSRLEVVPNDLTSSFPEPGTIESTFNAGPLCKGRPRVQVHTAGKFRRQFRVWGLELGILNVRTLHD